MAARGARAAGAHAAHRHSDGLPQGRSRTHHASSGVPAGARKAGMDAGRKRATRRALDRGRYGSRALRGGKSGEVKSGRHRCHRRPGDPRIAAALAHDPDRRPRSERSGRRGLGDKFSAAGRQSHRLYDVRAFHLRQVACIVKADRAQDHSRCLHLQSGQSKHRVLQAQL